MQIIEELGKKILSIILAWLTVVTANSEASFHRQVVAHAEHTKKVAVFFWEMAFLIIICFI